MQANIPPLNESQILRLLVRVLVVAAAVALSGCRTAGITSATDEDPVKPRPVTGVDDPDGAVEILPPPRLLTSEDDGKEALSADVGEHLGLLGEVFFAFDRADLSEEAKSGLERNARYLLGAPAVTLTIEGHCDERGTNEYNLALGHRRAAAARDYLVRLGVEPGRLSTVSFGEERGVCYLSDESCWQRNRRAYFRRPPAQQPRP